MTSPEKKSRCDLTEKNADFEAQTIISSDFRFRLQDLLKIIARIFFLVKSQQSICNTNQFDEKW